MALYLHKQRWEIKRKKRIFRMAPIHHHFELMGIPESKVTFRLWIMALLCGGLALSIIRLRGIL